MLARLLKWLKQDRPNQYQPPFQVERLCLEQVQLRRKHLSALASLSPDQLEAIAQLSRIMATFVRGNEKGSAEARADGVLLLHTEILKLRNKHNSLQKQEQVKEQKKAKAKNEPLTWRKSLLGIPRI